MTIQTTTHLNFRGSAREALAFYAAVFDAQVVLRTYADVGMPAHVPGAHGVVFGLAVGENGFRVMAYDIPGATEGTIAGGGSTRRQDNTTITDQAMFVSISSARLDEVQRYWDGLAEGAVIVDPLAASPWSAGFGMLTDRFGVTWSVSVADAQ